ncbi:hypothetical protein F3B47_00905 [Bacteroides fragilis]|uniref:Transmembrane protein n=1 Tax=Bacteroides fragilis (strain YCH46) TaxID=295405 RepID=Q64U28_BACFR|nr:hypothetical protein F3B36_02245 [Bacteroides fragilis]BAD49001.1 hypothetical protein BF2254 [Bacteroides fragilis YCH46]KAA4765093.1 hypothetical protein F3B47_00905 [Bacteroides fragilis]KAA4768703.1 hypothetical protein F3B25_02240 [Bacteroides fragilis]KAA4770016.1 hypothetical protein F3B24_02250 [Bacteroides fragilis]
MKKTFEKGGWNHSGSFLIPERFQPKRIRTFRNAISFKYHFIFHRLSSETYFLRRGHDFRLNDIWLMNQIVFSSFYYCISLVCFDLSLSLFGIRL